LKEEKRKIKLQKIPTKLLNGEHVQNRTLEMWLTKDEFKTIEEMWDEQKEFREDLIESKPEEIVKYQKRFNKAEFSYNKGNNYSLKKNHITAKSDIRDADNQFESLLEYLEEILNANFSLYKWFDRDISFESGYQPNINPVGMPRTISSSEYNFKYNNINILTTNQVKQQVVELALRSIDVHQNNSELTTKQKEIVTVSKKHALNLNTLLDNYVHRWQRWTTAGLGNITLNICDLTQKIPHDGGILASYLLKSLCLSSCPDNQTE